MIEQNKDNASYLIDEYFILDKIISTNPVDTS